MASWDSISPLLGDFIKINFTCFTKFPLHCVHIYHPSNVHQLLFSLSTFSPSTLSCLPLLTLSSYYSCPYRASSESVKSTLFPLLGNIYMSNLGASSIPNFSKCTECRLVIIYLTVNIHTKVKTCNIYFLGLDYLTHNDVFLFHTFCLQISWCPF